MCPMPGTLTAYIRIYWNLATIVNHNITLRQSSLSLIIKRRLSGQSRCMNTLMGVVVSKAMEANEIMTMASVIVTRTNLMEGIIKNITTITLEKVFKRG